MDLTSNINLRNNVGYKLQTMQLYRTHFAKRALTRVK